MKRNSRLPVEDSELGEEKSGMENHTNEVLTDDTLDLRYFMLTKKKKLINVEI
jgi:hypothetical protein